eukprot:CAMPEP_0201921396 /NCGR_PEP_ID=MMETSP0903-20130614/9742_1 /ASSEMBLY_ACC=CAM_ASM_000552 /TAXON_ID=420261 /ORGANISM="Thalassiosira antarctica, Strain CCMP982" /LENGTH=42 /DNA_ID= /DNA_START= /DNA_END= /DNA_ORIENTATION=
MAQLGVSKAYGMHFSESMSKLLKDDAFGNGATFDHGICGLAV